VTSAPPRGRRWLRRVAAAGLGAVAAGTALAWAAAWWVPLPDRLVATHSTEIRWRDGGPAWVDLSPDEKWRMPADLDRIDPDYVRALVRLEDERFWVHPGVDPIAVVRATGENWSAGRVVSGASTITMQLARLADPRPRTLSSKVVEAARAVQLEIRLSKEEILAAYLTFVPFGRNLEGVEAASWAYFGHSAEDLSAAEIATLLAVPQDPNGRYPSPRNAPRLRAARDAVATRLLAQDALPAGSPGAPLAPEQVLAQVREAPVPVGLVPVPRAIPHAAAWLRRTHRNPALDTTLDRGTQALVERILDGSREEARQKGIRNVAVVVVDHETAEIRALAGSFDFWDERDGGQIVAFDNPRSPGSTLKPLIYARAIDRGIVLPEHLRPDVPVRYGAYAPENYDGRFNGVVPMEEALSRSLNIPFVTLLQDVGVEPFLADLRAMGARHLVPTPGHYGLSVAAGGIELSPLEMAALYVTLAHDGVYRPLAAVPRDEPIGREVFAHGAAWLTRRALAIKDRPDFPARRDFSRTPRHLHWKTGTSFGHRDAWAIGSGRRHTVVVWLGNVDNTPSRHLVGAEAAGPILFDLLEGLDDGAKGPAEPAPPDLVQVEVCALTGHLPTAACPLRSKALALGHKVPTARCPYHHAVEVDASGMAVGPSCREGRVTRVESFVLWPSAVRRWLDERRRWQPSPPAWAPGCDPVAAGAPPRILSPGSDEVFVLIPGVAPDDQEIPLEAEAAVAHAPVHWYLDGAWLGTARADERLWWTPKPGTHTLVAMDDAGRTHQVRVEVRDGRLARAR
jgi:penicillin-binding protein 1C